MWKSPCPTEGEPSNWILFLAGFKLVKFGFLQSVFWLLFSWICCVLQLPKGRDVEDDDQFVFNDAFSAPLYRIKVHKSFLGCISSRWPEMSLHEIDFLSLFTLCFYYTKVPFIVRFVDLFIVYNVFGAFHGIVKFLYVEWRSLS